MHLVLEVQTDEAVQNAVERMAGELRELLREERVRTRSLAARGREIRLTVRDAEAADRVPELLKNEITGLIVASRGQGEGGVGLVLRLVDDEAQRIELYAVEQGIETTDGDAREKEAAFSAGIKSARANGLERKKAMLEEAGIEIVLVKV